MAAQVHACMRWRRDENAGAPLDGARMSSLSLPSPVSLVRRTGEQVAVHCHVRMKGLVMLPRRNTPPQHLKRRTRSHDTALAGVATPSSTTSRFAGLTRRRPSSCRLAGAFAVCCHVRMKGLVMLPRRNTPPQHRDRRTRSHDAALAGVAMPNASPTFFDGVVILLTRAIVESSHAILHLVEICWVNPEKAIFVPSRRSMLKIIKNHRKRRRHRRRREVEVTSSRAILASRSAYRYRKKEAVGVVLHGVEPP
uniref:Uncharacterized protein n=1 Tax=Oryza barthii TaxID=65489 RepID=A0A0D3GZH5_9ORYZ